jgi:uncharacterized membrane protein
MTPLHLETPLGLAVAGWLALTLIVAEAAWTLRRGFLPSPVAQHAWLGAIVLVALLWSLHVPSPVGLDFGLLGSALFALVFGRSRALAGLTAALLLHVLLDGGSWRNAGLNGLIVVAVPVWLATALQRQIERRLPKNLFVFIIGNGLFGTLVATACAAALGLALATVQSMAPARQFGDHLAYALLLAWGEALASGMLFSALVIFAPAAVLTYRQDLYLPPRRRPS